MTRISVPVRVPEFPADITWLQGGPLTMQGLRGRPVLIDFWDYTCVNCLRTIPYLKEWNARYAPLGLAIIGAHSPEFTFARERGYVARAVGDLGIEYPVLLDNSYSLWMPTPTATGPPSTSSIRTAISARTTSVKAPTRKSSS